MMNIKFWLNAFIPKDVPNYTQTIRRGTHANKTAVPLPGVARLNPLNWKDWEAGFLTDQRTFNNSPSASCRMQSLIEIKLGSVIRKVSSSHSSSGTTEVNIKTGAQLGFAKADMNRCSFSTLTTFRPPANVHCSSSGARLLGSRTRLKAAAGDPLVSAAADIDYKGLIEVVVDPSNPSSCTVTFEGKIDAFPAYECYVKLDNVTKTIFTSSPPPGNTVTNLLGSANRPVSGTATFP